jgi:5-hydroxyisourate hydrolase
MSAITTHVLDTAKGRPAAGVPVKLEFRQSSEWTGAGRGVTDADGRCRTLLAGALTAGEYRITFDTSAFSTFYPSVTVHFAVTDAAQHYHVPLLLSPYGYSTYRGS